MNESSTDIFYKRHLPHYQPHNETLFITFRLAHSIPNTIIRKMQEQKEVQLKYISSFCSCKKRKEEYENWQSGYFLQFDEELHSNKKKISYLSDPRIAGILKEAIHLRDKKEYDLIAYSIMPNHVHIMFLPKTSINNRKEDKFQATKILKSLKWYTAREGNRILGRKGAFWQDESYDHVVRNEKEFKRIVNYILNNPVKARLVERREDWKWNYANFDLMSF